MVLAPRGCLPGNPRRIKGPGAAKREVAAPHSREAPWQVAPAQAFLRCGLAQPAQAVLDTDFWSSSPTDCGRGDAMAYWRARSSPCTRPPSSRSALPRLRACSPSWRCGSSWRRGAHGPLAGRSVGRATSAWSWSTPWPVRLVTPDMHRVHHSAIGKARRTAISASICPGGDRLFGTYRAEPAAGHNEMTIGLPIFRNARELRLDRMLTQSFRAPADSGGVGRP